MFVLGVGVAFNLGLCNAYDDAMLSIIAAFPSRGTSVTNGCPLLVVVQYLKEKKKNLRKRKFDKISKWKGDTVYSIGRLIRNDLKE